ncbi:hypothetical protein AC579_4586 [Pseudocercospora musae]|uniref:AAA+ ATPase domain-containing protein n=1 Tax=Pseudocercospora musae TaxID=113226 RepID=A0A139ITP3_9PEZI|nr:hypothetical protein AC579_4586 [Pseudocercospora musae]KXT18093.1 hypothetical protein AC579_4586 [Pseudocercospora musae]
MPSARKNLLEALVKQQQIYKTDSEVDDVIAGKGQGLVLLLPGPPGTGKTLTAESVADRLQIPLYAVSASELGDTVAEVEEKFGHVLQLAAQWNAVLLLDEANAFLEKRVDHPSARDRNKRVAAFLRILEYYKGILILTTNRMISFDDAFYSRIHLTLPFKGLDIQSRKGIWKNFLRGAEISEEEILEFAKEEFNGRQIKNVMKMARFNDPSIVTTLSNNKNNTFQFKPTHPNHTLNTMSAPNQGRQSPDPERQSGAQQQAPPAENPNQAPGESKAKEDSKAQLEGLSSNPKGPLDEEAKAKVSK